MKSVQVYRKLPVIVCIGILTGGPDVVGFKKMTMSHVVSVPCQM